MKHFILVSIALVGLSFGSHSRAETAAFDTDYMIGLARSLALPAQLAAFDAHIRFFIPSHGGGNLDAISDYNQNQSDRSHCKIMAKLPIHAALPEFVKADAKSACGIPMLHVNYVYTSSENFLGVNRFTLSPLGSETKGFLTAEGKIVGFEHRQFFASNNQTADAIYMVLPNGAVATQTSTDARVKLSIVGANNSFVYTSTIDINEAGRSTLARVVVPTIQQDETLVIEDKTNNSVSSCLVEVVHGDQIIFHKELDRSCDLFNKSVSF